MAACSLQARSSLRNSFNSRFNDCSSGPRDAISGETGNVSNCRKFPLHQLAREIWPFCSGLTCVRARELRRHAALEIWPDLSSAAAATGTDEARLDTREANIVRPAIGAQSDMMAAMAIDEDAAQAHLPHLAEVILTGRPSTCVGVWRRAGRGMPPSKRGAGQSQIINPLGLGTRASYCASWGLRSRAHAVGAELERARFAWRFFLLPFLGVASCRSCFSGRSHRVATAPPDGGNRAAQRCSNLR